MFVGLFVKFLSDLNIRKYYKMLENWIGYFSLVVQYLLVCIKFVFFFWNYKLENSLLIYNYFDYDIDIIFLKL